MFDTAVGCCGIAWGDAGICAMLRGEPHKLDTLVFDMRGTPGLFD